MSSPTPHITAPVAALLFAGVVAGALAGCERHPRQFVDASFEQTAQVSLFNATYDLLVMESQHLRRAYAIDCELVTENPSRYLREEHLSNANKRYLLSGVESALQGAVEQSDGSSRPELNLCRMTFVRVEDERIPSVAVSWANNLPTKRFYADVDVPAEVPPEAPVLIAEADYSETPAEEVRSWRDRPCNGAIATCTEEEYENALRVPTGATYYWSALGEQFTYQPWTSQSLAEMPVEDPQDQCRTGRGTGQLSWSAMTTSTRWQVVSVSPVIPEYEIEEEEEGATEVPPRCFDTALRLPMGDTITWQFCGSERLAWRLDPEVTNSDVYVEFFTENQYSNPPNAYESLSIDINRYSKEDGVLYEVETIELVRGHGIPEHIGLDWSAGPMTECDPRREIEECNQIIVPSRLQLRGSIGQLTVKPGETIALDAAAERRVELVRGLHRAVSDSNCHDPRLGPHQLSHPGTYLELIYYTGVTAISE